MDFQINFSDGIGRMSFVKNTDIRTNIYLSINTLKGAWFLDPNFGMARINKITNANVLLQKQYVQDALAWIIQAGRATKIDVTVEPDFMDINRINLKVIATQPDGLIIHYTQFVTVGGPSPAFIGV
jgi:phage gp46-like protein